MTVTRVGLKSALFRGARGLWAVAFESETSYVQYFMLILHHSNSAECIDLECLGEASKLYLCALGCNICPSVSAQLLDIIKVLCLVLTTH